MTPDHFKCVFHIVMSSNEARAESKEAKSTTQASIQRAVSSSSRRLMFEGWEEARATFFDVMDEWFGDYLRNCPNIPRPPPPLDQPDEDVPRGMVAVRISKAPVDKLRKYGAEEFRAKVDDDTERAEF